MKDKRKIKEEIDKETGPKTDREKEISKLLEEGIQCNIDQFWMYFSSFYLCQCLSHLYLFQ